MVRFPSYEHLVESGLATNREMIQLKQMDELVMNKHQIKKNSTIFVHRSTENNLKFHASYIHSGVGSCNMNRMMNLNGA